MAETTKVAEEARTDAENFLIVARMDALAGVGLDGTLRRCEAYRNAGAVIDFPEAPRS